MLKLSIIEIIYFDFNIFKKFNSSFICSNDFVSFNFFFDIVFKA